MTTDIEEEEVSIQTRHEQLGSTLELGLEDTAKVVVIYSFKKGTSLIESEVHVEGLTNFADDTRIEIKSIANLALHILCDEDNIERFYMSIANNISYVPTKLRNRPN